MILGQGRTGVAEKGQALMHQTMLDYGPTADRVRKANHCVRQCLTDMGTEIGVCDTRDFVSEVLDGQAADVLGQDTNMMYPFALKTPGTQHIIDGTLKMH